MYYLGFDVETAGEYHEAQLMSVAFSIVDDAGSTVEHHLFIIVPDDMKKDDHIDVETDYEWSKRCWEEFGCHHHMTLNATQNTPKSRDVTRVKLRGAAMVIRKYYDEVCAEYEPKVGVDNPAYDCFWISRLFTSKGLRPMEYQKKKDGTIAYRGVVGYSSALRYLPKGTITVMVSNDHDPLNDSLRHALHMMHLEQFRKTVRVTE
jgi:hypothetical protein